MHRVVEVPGWKRPRGYSNGIIAEGKMLFIAGQIGWDATKEDAQAKGDFATQFDLALANVVRVLREAGGLPEHLARVTVYVTDKEVYEREAASVGQEWRRVLGRVYPAMTLVEVSRLLEKGALVEVEATAVIPEHS